MSGPMAAGFDLGVGVVIAAEAIAQGMAEAAAAMDEADRQAEETRQQRKTERQRMRAARANGDARQEQATALRTQLTELLAVLEESGADQSERSRALASSATPLQEQLAVYLAHAQAAVATNEVALRRALVARVLERLQLDTDTSLPPTFAALARDIVAAPTPARAEALASELRLQVQQWNAERARAAEQKQRQDAAALVLEQSLRDLGYAVEDIEETLFVAGGIAHFQKPGWGDYFVRLRIDPQRQAMNFNVVRAGTAGEDRKHEDMLAEDRWCSEFPKLFATLKARGIAINVTRLLQAGEAPVQVVAAASLPARHSADERHAPLKARSLP